MPQIIAYLRDAQISIIEDARVLILYKRSFAGEIKLKGENMTTITDIQKVGYTVTAADAKGNPTALPGVPTWNVSDPSILTITPSADGSSADVAAVGPEGSAQVNVSVADPANPSGAPLTGQDVVTVVGSAAATLKLVAGTPVAQ